MARNSAARRWFWNVLKVLITVGGFYLLLTHEVSTWVKGDHGLWFVPVSGPVAEVRFGEAPLARADDLAALREGDASGWAVDGDLLFVRVEGNPAREVAVPGEPELGHLPIARAIADYVQEVDPAPFILWSIVAMLVKFSGVLTSAWAWTLLLRGQGLRFPFWQQVLTAFLIGRFIGTFLPSTIGLDGYTLYEAGRYSNQWSRVVTAKALEKFIGIAGLFSGLLLTLPAGYFVLQDVAGERGLLITVAIGLISGGVTVGVVVGLLVPRLIRRLLQPLRGKLPGPVDRLGFGFLDAAAAYGDKPGVVFGALLAKFVTHFTTAVVYYFTALAIGVVGVQFFPIVFGSLIQILGTLFSPTIAGEGAREALQALLLSNYLGGAAQAVLSAALGFVAAEAATMWGGAFLWTRTAAWRPRFMTVDGAQVDYAWLVGDEGGFDADAVARMRARGGDGAP